MKIGDYFRETRAEMKHVTWPSRAEALSYTIIVILISLGTAAFLGLLDYVFSLIIQKFI